MNAKMCKFNLVSTVTTRVVSLPALMYDEGLKAFVFIDAPPRSTETALARRCLVRTDKFYAKAFICPNKLAFVVGS
jgi:hypothetical protein